MDFDLPLLFLALLSAAAVLVRSIRSRPVAYDWVAVGLLVAGAAGIGQVLIPGWAGVLSFSLWFVLGWAPVLLSRGVLWAMERLRYDLAARIAWTIYLLHPSRVLREQSERWRVHALEQAGDKQGAIRALAALAEQRRNTQQRPGPSLVEETLTLLRLEGRYEEIDAMIARIPASALLKNPGLLPLLVRLDLETGQVDRAFDHYQEHELVFAAPPMAYARVTTRLVLLALGGRERAVDALLEGQLANLAEGSKELWRATAALAAGQPNADARLFALAESHDHILVHAALARVRVLDAIAGGPREDRSALLDRIEHELDLERRYVLGSQRPSRPLATWVLTASLFVAFALELAMGGSTDVLTLYRLGALEPDSVLTGGEWPRLFGFLFLHYGAAHLTFNSLGLIVLGPFAERALGLPRFLTVYFASGVAGGLALLARYAWIDGGIDIMVGASGCIMGLVGASTAIFLRGFLRERAALAKRRLGMFLLVIVLQTIADFQIPQVSFMGHAVGALTGFLLALLLGDRLGQATSSSP